ncbi:hypothetical protein VP01_362g1 [Puccinia sorghi]|uniref:Uncharacterized protein n=1 Tax=Puccinia sorghi TaxID=27349 RepID=A0A0L6UUT5_9BASI|nr:hypothetical protein VP01_362g1 [Puccinia sorghi]
MSNDKQEKSVNTKPTKHKKKRKSNPNNKTVALLTLIIKQMDLGKGTENCNLKAKGWTQPFFWRNWGLVGRLRVEWSLQMKIHVAYCCVYVHISIICTILAKLKYLFIGEVSFETQICYHQRQPNQLVKSGPLFIYWNLLRWVENTCIQDESRTRTQE